MPRKVDGLEIFLPELEVSATEQLGDELRPRDVLAPALQAHDPLRCLGGTELERVGAFEGGELEHRGRCSEPAEEGGDPLVGGVVELAPERRSLDLEAARPWPERGEALRDLRGVQGLAGDVR